MIIHKWGTYVDNIETLLNRVAILSFEQRSILPDVQNKSFSFTSTHSQKNNDLLVLNSCKTQVNQIKNTVHLQQTHDEEHASMPLIQLSVI